MKRAMLSLSWRLLGVFFRRCVLLTLCCVPSPQLARQLDGEELYDLVRDAQKTNIESFDQGKMSFAVSLRTQPSRAPIEVRATAYWRTGRCFWSYQICDPNKEITPSWERKGPVESAKVEYVLISGDQMYWYNAYGNFVAVYKFEGSLTRGAVFWLLSVLPQSNWYRYRPPYAVPGMSWYDLIGPRSPALRPGSKLKIESLGNGTIVQTRDDGDEGRDRIVFRVDFCGNVTEGQYISRRPDLRSSYVNYEWRKLSDGRCALRSCEYKISARGKPDIIETVYRLDITSFDAEPDLAAIPLTFEAFKALLPGTCLVDDHITGKEYRLFPSNAPEGPAFESFSDELKQRGFLMR